mmetsp:Transcript_15457/g.37056  ORF Transcript_15457/g.37056 Transcript_15457/m.37056 type:complete len:85 (+) Transcript_15457:1416-1670(+)
MLVRFLRRWRDPIVRFGVGERRRVEEEAAEGEDVEADGGDDDRNQEDAQDPFAMCLFASPTPQGDGCHDFLCDKPSPARPTLPT